ncbi:TRAP transporter TatT component family protein [Nitrospirota bacterium]
MMKTDVMKSLFYVVSLMIMFLLSGCATGSLGTDLSIAILNQPDLEIVRDGAPAYLILVDALVERKPKDPRMLGAATQSYALYAGLLADDQGRARRLSARARDYGQRALCASNKAACGVQTMVFDDFKMTLDNIRKRDIGALYSFTISWLLWVKTNSDDLAAIAELPKLEVALQRILELDEEYKMGTAHVYMGILKTLRPPMLGGKPDEARRHFERAIELSGGRNLGAKVDFARNYARMMYDRQLHDRLLDEVLKADPEAPGLTLLNNMAKRDAIKLLKDADEYF